MATFSVNQARQLYVMTNSDTTQVVTTDADLQKSENYGAVLVGGDTAKTHMYIKHHGVAGITRSDLIEVKNILSVKATDADSLAYKLKSYTVSLDSTVNGGTPVVGQDYLLRIAFRQFVGMSDEDQYFKFGVVRGISGMTASDFYKRMAISLAKNFSREVVPLVKIEVTTGSGNTEVTPLTRPETLTGTYTGIVITEVEQPWRLGVMQQTPVYFNIYPDQIMVEGDERTWGTVTPVDKDELTVVPDGKLMADLEYFCMGERADQYRGINWPHNIPTTYMVDPSLAYNVIDIHYAYVGSNEAVQKSEKTLTILVPKVGATNSVSNVMTNNVLNAIRTATGLTTAELPNLDTSAS